MNSGAEHDLRSELRRVLRVSDMLCSAHAGLRDRFQRRAKILDLAIFLVSAWLLALAFAAPQISSMLKPASIPDQIWAGLLAFFVFSLSIWQLLVDWKGQAFGHAVSFRSYATIKREAKLMLSADHELDVVICTALLSRYEAAAAVQIPEAEFLRQKKRHLVKVQLSKNLDQNPGTSLWWAKLKLTWSGPTKILKEPE